MKTKYIVMYAALAVAFAAVSLWVAVGGRKNARAVAAKYRLGGLMLTVSAMLSASSCQDIFPGMVSCYDPVMPSEIDAHVWNTSGNNLSVGDTIAVVFRGINGSEAKYRLETKQTTVLQSGNIETKVQEDNSQLALIKLQQTSHKGEVFLFVYFAGEKTDEIMYFGNFNIK
ncbi:MAG: hypothetical protein HUJ94_03040 [Bacteroidales bacterium]|nr:hypothetical protein [Bacteroidales bacterium]